MSLWPIWIGFLELNICFCANTVDYLLNALSVADKYALHSQCRNIRR
jgi:hypothetical protein